ncbi:hypothetical protein [Paraburkholderia sp. J7]|uniref:hypothetical protein n=1 Tax=Paraburkholderia sp. J7 TaxID=2805438 RepID=UPI002AB722B8|nr:hypothetical protein [Paraburkholderia sp. J7]
MRDADLAIRAIRDLGRRIVTFSGFSSNGYEDQSDVQRIICEVLDKLDPRTDIVCSGATRMGIGAVYALASSRGFESLGIVSTRARKEHVPFADDVDIVYVIEDESWGGYIDKRGTPSPTSRVMVDVSDMLVFIGGGDIARDEYDYAKRRRKAVEFFVADANHAAAIDQARRRGEPAPTDFRGSLALHCEAETK